MPRYKVTIDWYATVQGQQVLELEAKDEQEAMDKADAMQDIKVREYDEIHDYDADYDFEVIDISQERVENS